MSKIIVNYSVVFLQPLARPSRCFIICDSDLCQVNYFASLCPQLHAPMLCISCRQCAFFLAIALASPLGTSWPLSCYSMEMKTAFLDCLAFTVTVNSMVKNHRGPPSCRGSNCSEIRRGTQFGVCGPTATKSAVPARKQLQLDLLDFLPVCGTF